MTPMQPLSGPAGTVPPGLEPSLHAARHEAVKDAKGREPLYDIVMRSLDEDQAQEVIAIPLEGKSAVADYMVIASGRSTRQVAAIAQKLAERIKHGGFGNSRIEGLPAADWVLIDAGDIVVHVFRPEVRSFYNLERMWAFGDGGTTVAS
jgi:ribosome-associated protein